MKWGEHRRHRSVSDVGQSLVEVILAAALMGTLFVPAAYLIAQAGKIRTTTGNRQSSYIIANGELDYFSTLSSVAEPPTNATTAVNKTVTYATLSSTTWEQVTKTNGGLTTIATEKFQAYVKGGWCAETSSGTTHNWKYATIKFSTTTHPVGYFVQIKIAWGKHASTATSTTGKEALSNTAIVLSRQMVGTLKSTVETTETGKAATCPL